MTFLAGLTLVTLSAVFVLMPLFKEPKGNLEIELLAETELDRLLNRKAVIYSNLKDLEFEHKMGRLGETDFHRLESGFKAEAAEVLSKLDQLGVEENLEESIEQAVSARKEALTSGPGKTRAEAACPSCGAHIISGKKFCADCGHRLS